MGSDAFLTRIGILPWAGPPRGGVARRGGLRARCDRKSNALLTRWVFFADALVSDASATCQGRVGTGHASATRQGRVRNALECVRRVYTYTCTHICVHMKCAPLICRRNPPIKFSASSGRTKTPCETLQNEESVYFSAPRQAH